MRLSDYILLAIAVVVGGLSARKNPTAAALVACWVLAVGFYLIAGHSLPQWIAPFADAVVMAVIMMKPNYRDFDMQETWWGELKCFVLERTPSDRIILASYVAAWILYTFPTYQYWPLWIVAALQFFAAGWEVLSAFIHRHAEVMKGLLDESSSSLVVCPAGGWGVG